MNARVDRLFREAVVPFRPMDTTRALLTPRHVPALHGAGSPPDRTDR